MIQALELRIGNFVNDFTGRVGKVLEFSDKEVRLKLEHSNLKISTAHDMVGLDIEAIPLSNEILENNCRASIWYRDTMMKTYKINVGEFIHLLVNLYDGSCAIIHINGNCSGDFGCIKYLHQLQNLVYSLRGSELEVVW